MATPPPPFDLEVTDSPVEVSTNVSFTITLRCTYDGPLDDVECFREDVAYEHDGGEYNVTMDRLTGPLSGSLEAPNYIIFRGLRFQSNAAGSTYTINFLYFIGDASPITTSSTIRVRGPEVEGTNGVVRNGTNGYSTESTESLPYLENLGAQGDGRDGNGTNGVTQINGNGVNGETQNNGNGTNGESQAHWR